MTAPARDREAPVAPFERKLPPVVGAAMAALSLAVVGAVVLVAQIGQDEASLVVPTVLVAGAGLGEIVAVALLITIRRLAWDRFWSVFGVALIAYVLQAGLIEWTFIKNDVPSGPLVLLTAGLVVFATIVPLMIAFTVARYQAVDAER